MKDKRCIDAGREGCPCALAEYEKCLVCGRLSGGTCQDCSWQGTCIYTIYQQNRRNLVSARGERELNIESVRVYSDNFKVFVIGADKGFCQKAQTAGAYVFVQSRLLAGVPIQARATGPRPPADLVMVGRLPGIVRHLHWVPGRAA